MSFPANTFNLNRLRHNNPVQMPGRPTVPIGTNFSLETYEGTHTCEGCKRNTKIRLSVQAQGGAFVEDKTLCFEEPIERDGNINISLKINAGRPNTVPARGEKYIAMFDFSSASENELDLEKDELVTILQRENSGWSLVENAIGKTGWAPEAYLRKDGPIMRSGPPTRTPTAPPPYSEN